MSRPLRFLALNYEYPPIGGGGGVLSEHVLENFVERGHEASLVTSGFSDLPSEETRKGVDIHRLPVVFRLKKNTASIASMLSYHPLACRAATALGKQTPFDAVLTFFAIPTGPAGHRVSKRLAIPNALFLLGGDVYDPSKKLSPHKTPLLKQTVRHVINNADYVTAGSSDTRASALKYYGVQRDVEVVPLSIEPFDVPDTHKSEVGLNDDDILIVTVGRLVRRKNNEALLNAIETLARDYPVQLAVVGSGPQHEPLQALINEKNLNARVRLLGNISDDDKARYLAAADIYASASIHEGFGLVFLEAMHASLPVVCYDNGGQADFVRHEKNGFIVSLHDQNAFTASLRTLIKKPDLRQQIGQFNHQDVQQYFVNNACERYLQSIIPMIERHQQS